MSAADASKSRCRRRSTSSEAGKVVCVGLLADLFWPLDHELFAIDLGRVPEPVVRVDYRSDVAQLSRDRHGHGFQGSAHAAQPMQGDEGATVQKVERAEWVGRRDDAPKVALVLGEPGVNKRVVWLAYGKEPVRDPLQG